MLFLIKPDSDFCVCNFEIYCILEEQDPPNVSVLIHSTPQLERLQHEASYQIAPLNKNAFQ